MTTIADSAAFTCRVSSSTASSPPVVRPACSHCESGPASSPILVTDHAEPGEEPDQRLGLTRHLGLPDDPPGPIHHAHAALFQRHVDPGIMLHGCPSMMPGADPFGPRTHHHSEGQPPSRSLQRRPITASIQDRDGLALACTGIRRRFPWLKHLFADAAYQSDIATCTAARERLRLEIVRRLRNAEGFHLVPRRWVIERTFAWLGRNRRLAKDFERLIATSTAMAVVAIIQLLMRRLARH